MGRAKLVLCPRIPPELGDTSSKAGAGGWADKVISGSYFGIFLITSGIFKSSILQSSFRIITLATPEPHSEEPSMTHRSPKSSTLKGNCCETARSPYAFSKSNSAILRAKSALFTTLSPRSDRTNIKLLCSLLAISLPITKSDPINSGTQYAFPRSPVVFRYGRGAKFVLCPRIDQAGIHGYSSFCPSRPARSWMNCQATRPERAPRVTDHSLPCARSVSAGIASR